MGVNSTALITCHDWIFCRSAWRDVKGCCVTSNGIALPSFGYIASDCEPFANAIECARGE